ncbi:zinc finger protein 106 isoform 1-T2 [Pholidichthys leucotaenia]
MMKNRKCILCETVHVSKQEMDEHMRSMLHHRELEKLKGRDCGHKCRVCKVKLVSLSDYASHISSPTHKQNVEAADQNPDGHDHDEDYFDQALVDLIEKRKEQIRKEKEAKAKEEEEKRRKEEIRKQKEAEQRYCSWQQPPQGFGGNSNRYSWHGRNQCYGRAGEAIPWHHRTEGKSATWHAQEPPNFHRWASEEFDRRNFDGMESRSSKTWGHSTFSCGQQSRFPWLSNGGSKNGLYGQNNISQFPQKGWPFNHMGTQPMYPLQTRFLGQTPSQFKSADNSVSGQKGQSAESEHNSAKVSKTLGSNPKLDKACRWSPYPVAKNVESVPFNDNNPNSSEELPKQQKQHIVPETKGFNRQPQPSRKPGQLTSSKQLMEEKAKHETKPSAKPGDGNSSSSRSSSSQRDDHQNTAHFSSNKAKKSLLNKDRKISSVPNLSGAHLSKAPSQAHIQLKSTGKMDELKTPPNRTLRSLPAKQLPESFKKVKQMLENKGTLSNCGKKRKEIVQHIAEKQRASETLERAEIGVNKENGCNENGAKKALPNGEEKPALSDSVQFLQSQQVSTSTQENPESAASGRDSEIRKEVEKQSSLVTLEESMQVTETGQSSESDTSRGCEVHTDPGPNATSLSKLDLPPVLKRDLKHINSKSKTGSQEPNLNIARRVRNLSGSRKSDAEKDSGLKPTVMQLISSSGSRRNVNWEQVYQEVRKKQDKGKGMPRFGIEMVPCEQEHQSLEEDDIALLEGFQWESLMDASNQGASRKRSLSESSVAPATAPSLSPSLMSDKTSQRGHFSMEQQRSTNSPDNLCVGENQDSRALLGHFDAKGQELPEKLEVKVRRLSDLGLGDSNSGAEQCDSQGTAKRRRATLDIPNTESSCLEHDSKRMKVKSKKERSQVDELLAVSLREEKLSRSLQTVDSSLIQARATLEAAYMEVQHLTVVKQQLTAEMSTLRNKRIELLKGMQGAVEAEPLFKLKEEKMDSFETEPQMPSSVTFSSKVEPAAPSPNHAADCASPPCSSLPFMSITVKQEPASPVHISSAPDHMDVLPPCPHSTTPELPVATATAPSDPAVSFQPSHERKTELYQTNFEEPAKSIEELKGIIASIEKAVQPARDCGTPLPDSESFIQPLLASRDSEVGSVDGCAGLQIGSVQSLSLTQVPTVPLSPPEMRTGKRVRKLKKRKALNKALGAEQPETSDTEMDEEASRPRWLRPRRRPSGGSQASNSSLPTEEKDGEINTDGYEKAQRILSPNVRLEQIDLKPLKQTAQPSHFPPSDPVGNLQADKSMEIATTSQQLHTDTLIQASPQIEPENSPMCDPCNLPYNEVSSTSDMELYTPSESHIPFSITLLKNSSDVSSDHGEDEMPTEGMFDGHQEAVNAMDIHNGLLYTCSGDRTVKAFDLVTHKCVGVLEGHSSKVNCLLVSVAPSLHHHLYSGSSDQTIRCYNLKTQEFLQQFSLSDRVLCLHSRWKTLYAGLANGTVVTFNLMTNKQMDVFECHRPRAVSCLASSQEGARKILLVGSFDSTISVRDAKNGLLLRTLEGHAKTVLCMTVVNDLVFSGSSDQCVYAHNIHTGELVRVYKGHKHAVTVVAVLGKVMVTACLDKLVRVYDLQSHSQLQVYGGHKDMVMCMTVHKNMIYTGCYDGSIQAVKLNLMQNYSCKWHGCSLVFGVMKHLQQHLMNDHHLPLNNFQMLKCHWKNCEEFFCPRSSTKQMLLLHMQKHAEEGIENEP